MIFLLACAAPDPGGDSTEAVTILGSNDLSCAAEVDPDVQTVINVSWIPPAAGTSRVEFGPTTDYGLVTPVTEGSEPIEQPLIGQGPLEEVFWRATTVIEGVTHACTGSTTTSVVPSGFPVFFVGMNDVALRSPAPYIFGAFFEPMGLNTHIAMFRRDGRIIWYHVGDSESIALQAEYARDGSGIFFNQFSRDLHIDEGRIQKVTLGSDVIEEIRTPLAHHMFVELEDGSIAYQQLDTRPWYDESTGETKDWNADAIAIIAPGGEAETVFSVWDWLTPAWNDHMLPMGMYGGLDWTHGNALKADAETFLLSLGHSAQVLTIDRATMSLTRVLEGSAASPPFDFQHDPTVLPDGNLLLVMTENDLSGAVEYAPGEPLTEVWRYGFTDHAMALGQATRLANGNTFVNLGARGRMMEVTPEGVMVWSAESAMGSAFGQFRLLSDPYTGE